MQVMVDGLLTHYETRGKGKTVVLVHGWGDRANGLGQLQQALSTQFQVVAPDLPGFGQTQNPPTAWQLTDYARFLQHFLQKIGASEVYAYVGHSNGGAIVIKGLATGVLSAERAVLLASAGIRNEQQGSRAVLRAVGKIGKVGAGVLPPAARHALRRRFYRAIGSDALVAEHLQATFKNIVADDIQDDARQVKTPALLIYGAQDTATPVRYGEMFARVLPQATLRVVPEAGHFVHQDQPAVVTQAIREFLHA